MTEQERRDWEREFPGTLYIFTIAQDAYNYVHKTKDNIDDNIDLKSFLYVLARYIMRRHISLYGGHMAEERKDKMEWLNAVYLAYDSKDSWGKKIPRDPNFGRIIGGDELWKKVLELFPSSERAVEPAKPIIEPPKPITEPLEQLTVKSIEAPESRETPKESPQEEPEVPRGSFRREDFITGVHAGVILGVSRAKVLEYTKLGLLARHETPFNKRGSYKRQDVLKLGVKLDQENPNDDKAHSPFNTTKCTAHDPHDSSSI